MKGINAYSTPINKTAALVTSQAGINDRATAYQRASKELRDIKDCLKSIDRAIPECETKKEKKELASMKRQLQDKVAPLKEKIKLMNISRRENMQTLIVRECMNRFSESEWKEIVNIAGLLIKQRLFNPKTKDMVMGSIFENRQDKDTGFVSREEIAAPQRVASPSMAAQAPNDDGYPF